MLNRSCQRDDNPLGTASHCPAPVVSAGEGWEAVVPLGRETCLSSNIHHDSNKSKWPPRKTQSPGALLYPEILLCFLLNGAATVQPQGAGLSLPMCKQAWWGKEGQGGKKVPFGYYSLRVNSSHGATSTTNSEMCAPKAPCCKSVQILSVSSVWWNHAHDSRRVRTATAQAAQAQGCRCGVTGGRCLKPSAVSKKYILGNRMATKLHQIWNWAGKSSSLNLFDYLTFQILGGFPWDYFKQDISLLFFKPCHSITEWDWISAEKFCFFRIQQLTPNEREKRSLSCDERTRKRAIA